MGNEKNMSIRTSETSVENTQVDFGLLDSRGRKIGAKLSTFEVVLEGVPEDHRGVFYAMAPGHYFMLRTQATRNGVEYGATQPSRHFATEEARERAIGGYLRSAELRASKTGRRASLTARV